MQKNHLFIFFFNFDILVGTSPLHAQVKTIKTLNLNETKETKTKQLTAREPNERKKTKNYDTIRNFTQLQLSPIQQTRRNSTPEDPTR